MARAPRDAGVATSSCAARGAARSAPLPDDEGDLADHRRGHAVRRRCTPPASPARCTLARGDGDKTLFFDAGMPVGARSTLRARPAARPAAARRASSRASSMRARATSRSAGAASALQAGRARAHQVERAVRQLAPARRGHPLLLLRLGARPLSARACRAADAKIACGSARIRGPSSSRACAASIRSSAWSSSSGRPRRCSGRRRCSAARSTRAASASPSALAPSSSTASARWPSWRSGPSARRSASRRSTRWRGRWWPSAPRASATARRRRTSAAASACARCRRW